MDHPPTPDRIIKAEEEIKTILPKRSEYLVDTSEYDDIRTRLESDIDHTLKVKNGPTLERRNSKSSGKQGKDQGDDQPPVLRRRD